MFTPSKYQQALFDFQKHDTRDAFVSAVAGSGKTTTLVQAAQLLTPIEREQAVFVAFNRHIAQELGRRLPPGMSASTIHSLGMQALRGYFCPSLRESWIDEHKYTRLVRRWQQEAGGRREAEELHRLKSLLRFTMLTLTSPDDRGGLRDLALRFGILVPCWKETREAIATILEWGKNGTPDGSYRGAGESISFEDMVYLPNLLPVPLPHYRTIYVDECQDLNAAERELLLKCKAPEGGRAFWIGDERQACYGFAGADLASVRAIAVRTRAVRLPLSICYRCPKSHIQLAKEIVPEIEPAPGAIEGIVELIRRTRLIERVQAGDLGLCRTMAPLVKLALELMAAGIPARVQGKEIGQELNSILDTLERRPGFSFDELPHFLEAYRQAMVCQMLERLDSQMLEAALDDKVESLMAVYWVAIRQGCRDMVGLRRVLSRLDQPGRDAVLLSTIHRAKGMEADRVFLLEPLLLPHPRATRTWEKEQEENLRYIALTRARRELYFV